MKFQWVGNVVVGFKTGRVREGQGAGVWSVRCYGWLWIVFLQYFDHCMWESREQKLVIRGTREDVQRSMWQSEVELCQCVVVWYYSPPSFCSVDEQGHGWGKTWDKLFGVEQDIWPETEYLHLSDGELRLKEIGRDIHKPWVTSAPLHLPRPFLSCHILSSCFESWVDGNKGPEKPFI